jgi:hypothetical protein
VRQKGVVHIRPPSCITYDMKLLPAPDIPVSRWLPTRLKRPDRGQG